MWAVGGWRTDLAGESAGRVCGIQVQSARLSDELVASTTGACTCSLVTRVVRTNKQAMAQRRQLQSELATAEERLPSATERHIDAIHDDGPHLKKTKLDDDNSCPLLSLGSDMLTRCASYLDPNDMVQLGCTSTLFGRIQPGCQRSFVNEVSHQILFLGASKDDHVALPKYEGESDIKLYRELLSMRQEPIFGTLLKAEEVPIQLS